MKVENKTIIVTGGANGVGRQLVEKLLVRKSKVIAVDINEEALNELASDFMGTNLFTYKVDIASKTEVTKFATKVLKEHDYIDGIINNAGIIQPFIDIVELDENTINRLININFRGQLNMIRAFMPTLKTREEAHILNISSMGAFLPVPGQGIYGASKAAVKAMSEALKVELRDTNIAVSVVMPGGISTNIAANSGITNLETDESASKFASAILLTPEKAAEQIIRTIEKNKFRVYLGKDSKTMKVIYSLSFTLATTILIKALASTSNKDK